METQVKHEVSPKPIDIDKVLEKIAEIARKSADGDYIYRGEPEDYGKVSSSLYREHPHMEGVHFDIESFQDAILTEAKTYIGKTDDIDETDSIGLLTEIQHFGGKTNLIDFTEDYLIALFFACDGSHEEDGQVILIKRKSDDYTIEEPGRTIHRVESQKSVFVRSPTGFVEPDSVVSIPVDIKFPMLKYLEKYHRISIATIYNDLHGFIRRSAYIEFLKGITHWRDANETKDNEEKDEYYNSAVRHYTEAIKLKTDFSAAYISRALVYRDKGELDKALHDFDRAIALNPEHPGAYNNRGLAYRRKGELGKALHDFDRAIALNPEYVEAYNDRGLTYDDKGELDKALHDFDRAIALNPEHPGAYNNRGLAYRRKGELGKALHDFDRAIALNPKLPQAYNNRGKAWLHLGKWQKAKADLTTAKEMGHDIIKSFQNDYGSVEAFEAKNGIKLLKDLAALLSGNTT